MSDFDQVPFENIEFAENPEPRCPCLLVLDNSGSMAGDKIRQLNEGLVSFASELAEDSIAAKRVEVAIVSFGPVETVQDFVGVEGFYPPTLSPAAATPMGAAVERALEMVAARKEDYKSAGVGYYRPWIFLITDGQPTDDISRATSLIQQAEESRSLVFFCVGVEGANMSYLEQLSSRAPLQLKGLQFRELFVWLSNSLGSVSRSQPSDEVPLENPATPDGWAAV